MQIDLSKVRTLLILPFVWLITADSSANEFDSFLKPLFQQNCYKCHGGEKTKGKVNLKEISDLNQLMGKPEMVKEIIEVVDALDMPPEDETPLNDGDREKLITSLKGILKASTASEKREGSKLRRLNRFQYNNACEGSLSIKN